MISLSLIKDFKKTSSYWDEDTILLISLDITDSASGSFEEEELIPEKLYIITSDLDRIYLSRNPEATPETDADYVIRTWDIHWDENNPEFVSINWTFHVMGDSSDGTGTCSINDCSDTSNILVYGNLASLRLAAYKGQTEITIPESVVEIKSFTFYGFTHLEKVIIPEGVTEIGPFAFYGCSGIKEIYIPDSVTYIGSCAFGWCDALLDISVPILNFSEAGFQKDARISIRTNGGNKVLPLGITRIYPEAYKDCSDIKSIQIPESVTHIGREAFHGCTGLKEVHIPDSVMRIGKDAFKGCKNLTEISVPLGLNIAAAGLEESTIVVVRDKDGIRVLPEGVTKIPESTFKDCKELKGIDIPDSVTTIGERAFWGCEALSEIHIPANVSSIAENAFVACSGLLKLSVSPDNDVYNSRDNCNAIIETETGRIIADCKDTVLPDSWFQSICDIYGFIGSDDPDEELRILTIIKYNFNTKFDVDDDHELAESIKRYVATKYHKDWYKNYIGTRKIDFDRPSGYLGEEILDKDHIEAFFSYDYMVNFVDYRLKTGHTKRQDRLTQFMRDYPSEVLDWLGDDYPDGSAVPYGFFKRIAQGGDYELFGFSKDEFLGDEEEFDDEVSESGMPFDYAAVLKERYGVDYAVDYLIRLDPWNYLSDCCDGTQDLILTLFSEAAENKDNEVVLKALAYFGLTCPAFKKGGPDLSIEMISRLAAMWKKGLISDDWLTDMGFGLAGVFDWEWGDWAWEEDYYPACPEEDKYRIWLLRLLESDFAEDIADYLKPLLGIVLEKEKNHNWEIGRKAIESFLEKTAGK